MKPIIPKNIYLNKNKREQSFWSHRESPKDFFFYMFNPKITERERERETCKHLFRRILWGLVKPKEYS